jgi:hypothetical protein
MKKLVKYFVLVTILLSLPMKANAQTLKFVESTSAINHVGPDGIETDGNYGKHITNNSKPSIIVKFKGYISYVYPYMGKEYAFGPEDTVYYAIYYDGNDEAKYGEIVRQADKFVLERVYPDGTYEDFTPPALTKKQKQDFDNKYNPVQVKKRMLEEEKKVEKEKASKVDKVYSDLIRKDLVKLTNGNNYTIYTYTKSCEEVFKQFSGFFSDVNYGNTIERNYDFNVEDVKNKIDSILKNTNIKIPLKVSLVPYQCKDFPEGEIQYTMFKEDKNQYELHILLFNNEMPMEEQFKIQFNKYLKEVKRYK